MSKIREAFTAVDADAWLDPNVNVLMFIDQPGYAIAKFMYYIGEEANHGAVSLSNKIVAYQIDDERTEWLRARVVPS